MAGAEEAVAGQRVRAVALQDVARSFTTGSPWSKGRVGGSDAVEVETRSDGDRPDDAEVALGGDVSLHLQRQLLDLSGPAVRPISGLGTVHGVPNPPSANIQRVEREVDGTVSRRVRCSDRSNAANHGRGASTMFTYELWATRGDPEQRPLRPRFHRWEERGQKTVRRASSTVSPAKKNAWALGMDLLSRLEEPTGF